MRFGQRGFPSSHWTTALGDRWFGGLLVCLTFVHWGLSNVVPLSEDELYYWAWSKRLSASYFDHPPMVAILIRLSTAVFGNDGFGIRFFSPLCTSLVAYLVGRCVKNRRVITMALFTPLFFWMSLIFTPDTPMLVFWTLYFVWTIRLAEKFSDWDDDPVRRVYHHSPVSFGNWSIGGLILGLGCLSKYTMVLAVPAVIICLSRTRFSAWWRGFLLHGLIASIVITPILVFNATHGFAPLLFQWEHGTAGDTPLRFFWEYLAAQVLLVGGLPFVISLWQFVRIRQIYEESLTRVAFLFFSVPFFFFLATAMHTKTEGNWGVMAYISVFPLAQILHDRSSFRRESTLVQWCLFAPVFVLSILVAIHLAAPLRWIEPHKDRIYRLREQPRVFRQIIHDVGQSPIFAPTYQVTAYLKHAGAIAYQWPGIGRASHFTLNGTDPCIFDKAYLVLENERRPTAECFAFSQIVATYDVVVRGSVVGRYFLAQYKK